MLGAGALTRRQAHGCVLLLAIGAAVYWARFAPLSETDLRVLLGDEARIVHVRGELLETPQTRDFSGRESSTARIEVNAIQLDGAWQEAHGVVMTRTRGVLKEDDYFQSRRVEVHGVIQRPPAARAEGLFDYRDYLFNARIFYQLHAEAPTDWRTLQPQSMPVIERLRRWAKTQLSRGIPEDEQVRTLWAMTLGWRTAMSGEMAEPFMRTGTMHIIAISGLHVACIAGILVIAMQMTGLARHRCSAVVIPLVWLYTVATGWQSSGVRAALMSTAVIAGWSLKRPAALVNSLAGSSLLILLFQPEQLFQAGFQLSFAVVLSIGLLVPSLEKKVATELPRDPFLPRDLQRPWKKLVERIYFYLRPSLIVSLACFIGSTPLVAYYFNLFTPISLLANLIAVPISSLALLFSMLSLAVPPLGELFNFFSWAFMWETILVVRIFDRLGGYFYVPKPNLWFALLYILFFVALFRGWLWQKRLWPWATAGLVLLAGAFFVSTRPVPKLHVLPGDGAPVWVNFPGRSEDLLLDCSNGSNFEFGVQRILRSRGVASVPALVLSHGDVDHVGGFMKALRALSPTEIFIGPHSSRSRYYRAALKLLEEQPHLRRLVRGGDLVRGWRVLHPTDQARFPRADDNAIVLQKEISGWRVLHLGDLGVEGQRSLLASGHSIAADILIVGSPSTGEPLRETLRDRISPAVIISERPLNWEQSGAARFNTHDHGEVTLEFRPGECRIKSKSGGEHRLRRGTR